jgi:hypothetical protein
MVSNLFDGLPLEKAKGMGGVIAFVTPEKILSLNPGLSAIPE